MNTNTQNGLKVKTNVKAGGWQVNHNETIAVNEPNVITDLEAVNAEEIKGGPNPKSKRIVVLQSSVTGQNSDLVDLEPQGEVKGGTFGHVKVFDGRTGAQTTASGSIVSGAEANGHVKVFSGANN